MKLIREGYKDLYIRRLIRELTIVVKNQIQAECSSWYIYVVNEGAAIFHLFSKVCIEVFMKL
jgi:hypothetical protein